MEGKKVLITTQTIRVLQCNFSLHNYLPPSLIIKRLVNVAIGNFYAKERF